MKRTNFTSEAELGRVVVAWLTDQRFEVYQEVQPSSYGEVADIVGTIGPTVCVVECKLSMGLRVINQARRWSQFAHLAYVAVPLYTGGRDFKFACDVAGKYGLGVLGVATASDQYNVPPRVEELQRPTFHRRAWAQRLRDVLNEHHKTFAEAGNSNGSRWSPFQETCRAVADYARLNPGCTMKQLIDNVKTHYGTPATARACITKYAEQGIIKGVRIERLGRGLRVWPA